MTVPDPSWAWRLGLHAMDLDASGHDTLSSSGLFYNVQDYGALGDGTTDDTTAISDTFDAADATGGGIIYLPPTANYYKTTTLINRTGTSSYHVLGGGARHAPARIHQATANTGVFKFAPSSGTTNRDKTPLIEGLVISGAGGASSGRGIEVANDCHIRDVLVAGFFDGIYIGGASYYSFIANSTITDCDNAAIHMVDGNNTTIDTCRITGNWGSASGLFGTLKYGIYATYGSPSGIATRIINSSIEYFTFDGIYLDGGYAVELIGNYFETQQSSSGKAHIRLGPSNTNYATRIESNYFQGDGTAGFDAIALDHANGIVIRANKFGINGAINISSTANTFNVLLDSNHNSPAGTFSLPATSYTLDPANPPATVGTPALTLGTANAAGSATSAVRTDATILAFDATAPTTSAIGDAAATGSAAIAARRDHAHGREALSTATPLVESGSGTVGTGVKSSREDHVHPAAAAGDSRDHEHIENVVFSGDGATTVWELPAAPVSDTAIDVFVAGSRSIAWVLSGAILTTLTFDAAPASATNNIVIDIEAAVA